jgi:hypothetical protein
MKTRTGTLASSMIALRTRFGRFGLALGVIMTTFLPANVLAQATLSEKQNAIVSERLATVASPQIAVEPAAEPRAELVPGAPTITSFDGYSLEGSRTTLRWTTSSERGRVAYQVERGVEEANGAIRWERIAFVPGHGSERVHSFYVVLDTVSGGTPPRDGSVHYRLRQIGPDGVARSSSPLKVAVGRSSARTPRRQD